MGSHPALLCVGLRSQHIVGSIAPRLIRDDGGVTVAASLPCSGEPLTTLAQRVTYLAGAVGKGVYSCEVVNFPLGVEVPIINAEPMDPANVPEWARHVMAVRGWELP